MSSIGHRLKESRERKGLLQSELAKLIGVKSAGVISNWEQDINKPNADKMVEICQALDISLSFLLDYYGEEEAPHYSSEAMEVARIYDTLDDEGKQRLHEAAKREQDIKASMDNLMRKIVVLTICDDPIVGRAGIELESSKLRDHPFSIPKKIPSDQRDTLTKLKAKQFLRPLGIRFRRSKQDQSEIVFIIDRGIEVAEGQPGLFTIDGKACLGKVQGGQFFAYPEDDHSSPISPNIKSEGAVIGFVDLKYIPGI